MHSATVRQLKHFVDLHYMIIGLDLKVTEDTIKCLTTQLVSELNREAVRAKVTPYHEVKVWTEGK